MRAEPFRCSVLSSSLGEPLFATASTVRAWVLVEQPGPWGYRALEESRMARGVGGAILAAVEAAGARLVLIRRPGRHEGAGRHCYVAWSGPQGSWLEHAHLESARELLTVDLSPLARGDRTGLGERESDPVFLVCTNGRRDPCCAERGRPVAAALVARFGTRVWECSHIGGDRYAPNLVCLPQGVYFGRLGADRANEVAAAFGDGRLDLAHYRGRSCYRFEVQAADRFLRTRDGITGVDDLVFGPPVHEGPGSYRVGYRRKGGSRGTVLVRRRPHPDARPLTCHAEGPLAPPVFEVVEPELSARGSP